MGCISWKTFFWNYFALIAVLLVPVCHGTTDPRDVFAINSLHAALGFPQLVRWVPVGGDPCADGWQGVQCVNANITQIILNGANLGGELGDNLGDFTSIIEIDLSNNHIGGVIPSNLPTTVRTLFLSSNQLTGSIPDTLSSLGQVTDLKFDENYLSGDIPDAFQQLSGLINLDLSGNNLRGHLPPSMASLSYLTSLHLENNRLIGTLDVLQDLPLRELNIENNLFSGPIPAKLLNIPNFRRDGNPFNTSVIPSPPALASLPSPTNAQSPELAPAYLAFGPTSPYIPNDTTERKTQSTKRVIWIAIAGVLVLVVLLLGLCLLMSRCCKRIQPTSKIVRTSEMSSFNSSEKHGSFPKLYSPREKGYKEPGLRPLNLQGKYHKRKAEQEELNRTASTTKNRDDYQIDMTGLDEEVLPPPPPPFFPVDKVTVNPILSPITVTSVSTKIPSSVRSFTIASLQQCTNSFSQENLVGEGMLGTVYRAETPSGRMLAVKKLDTVVCRNQGSEDFLKLVCSISKLQHPNIVELVGYCAEHGQQLLVYEYSGHETLYDALHLDDEIHRKLSWNTRIRMSLAAARALEYMHEVCQSPMVHKNFKSANILLDDELVVRVSDCGLAPLISSHSVSQLSTSGYGAPELDFGIYNNKSDVYSFGVVMLEILTGRKSYDRLRPRGEQFLVRWAIPQLHDIDSLSRMVDPSLNGAYPNKSLSRFADIISLCLQAEPEFRPPMSEIVQNLLHMV